MARMREKDNNSVHELESLVGSHRDDAQWSTLCGINVFNNKQLTYVERVTPVTCMLCLGRMKDGDG